MRWQFLARISIRLDFLWHSDDVASISALARFGAEPSTYGHCYGFCFWTEQFAKWQVDEQLFPTDKSYIWANLLYISWVQFIHEISTDWSQVYILNFVYVAIKGIEERKDTEKMKDGKIMRRWFDAFDLSALDIFEGL